MVLCKYVLIKLNHYFSYQLPKIQTHHKLLIYQGLEQCKSLLLLEDNRARLIPPKLCHLACKIYKSLMHVSASHNLFNKFILVHYLIFDYKWYCSAWSADWKYGSKMANYSNFRTNVSRWKFSNWIWFPKWRKTTNKKSSLYLSKLLWWRKTVLGWSLFKLIHTS